MTTPAALTRPFLPSGLDRATGDGGGDTAKRCPRCGETKPLDRFSKDRARKDGLRTYCRECMRTQRRRYRDTEKGREARRRERTSWRQANPEVLAANKRRYELSHKTERKAQQTLRRAVRLGEIVRGPCEVCGHEPAEGHHDLYSRPLDVRFLCHYHHTRLHRDRRDKARTARPRPSPGASPSRAPATRGRALQRRER